MTDLTRRRFLASTATAAGGIMASSILPPGLRRALANPPTRKPLRDIRHVVIITQENRSFDHYFGTLGGVRGFNDPDAIQLSSGKSVFYQPDFWNPEGYLLPFHMNTRSTSAQAVPSNAHNWDVQHAAWNNGKMDGWVKAQREAVGDINGPYTMGYYEQADIPFHFALAKAFTVCDRYHCSVLGATWPNRLYLWSASIDAKGKFGGPMTDNRVTIPYQWTTYPERLTNAGVSWHVYQEESDYLLNVLELFQNYQNASPGSPLYDHGLAIGPADQFEHDVANNQLPTVSWIVPTPQQSEHPAYMPASGADFLAKKLEAIASNPEIWETTVVIINYDENDGKFDHMVPPVPPPNATDEFVNGAPIGAGFRVPCIIVSPWTQGGWVCSEPFDHTSVLQFLEHVTGVRASNISDWRRHTFGDLTAALGLHMDKRFPTLPPTQKALSRAQQAVEHLPPTVIPGAAQHFPNEISGDLKPHSRDSLAPASKNGNGMRARPQSRLKSEQRIQEHIFPQGPQGTIFPGIIAGVMGRKFKREKYLEYVYVCTIVGNEVLVIDAKTGELVSGLEVDANPYDIVATPDQRKLYVTSSGESSVSVINVPSNSVIGSIQVGLHPHGIAISPDGLLVYVANTGLDTGRGGSSSVTVINTRTDRAIETIDVGTAPLALVVAPDNSSVYVSCHDGLKVIDAASRRIRATLPFASPIRGIAVAPDGKQLYVTNCRRNTVSVVDTKRLEVIKDIKVGNAPWDVAVHPDGGYVYVTNANSDTVSVIDTARQEVDTVIGVQHIPTRITATNNTVWVSNNTSCSVQAIGATTLSVIATIPLGLALAPGGIALA